MVSAAEKNGKDAALDAIFGVFIMIPIMLFALSAVYGAIARETLTVAYCAVILIIPWIFEPTIGGHSLSDKVRVLQMFLPICSSITIAGTWVGRFIRKAIGFCALKIQKQRAEK